MFWTVVDKVIDYSSRLLMVYIPISCIGNGIITSKDKYKSIRTYNTSEVNRHMTLSFIGGFLSGPVSFPFNLQHELGKNKDRKG